MKLIFAVVNNDDGNNVCAELIKAGFSVTKMSSTGGFLKKGNVTFFTAVEDDKVDEVLEIIKTHSQKRTYHINADLTIGAPVTPMEVTIGGATVFVTDIERFERV